MHPFTMFIRTVHSDGNFRVKSVARFIRLFILLHVELDNITSSFMPRIGRDGVNIRGFVRINVDEICTTLGALFR